MKFFLLLIAFVAGDLIGFNRGVNNAFQHIRAKPNSSSVDNRVQLIKYLLHLGRAQEAQQLMNQVGNKPSVKRNGRFKRYTRNQH